MGAPDMVVEVLSPGNTVDKINEKMSVCIDNGCVSFWVIETQRRLPRANARRSRNELRYDSDPSLQFAAVGSSQIY